MKNILSLLLILFSAISFGQNTPEILWAKVDSKIYNKLIDSLNNYYDVARNDSQLHELIKKEELKSLAYCNQLISEFPNSELVFDALYKKAFITYAYFDVDLARETFLKVVNFNTNKTAYKRKAYRILAAIEIDKKNYEKAIFYLDESSKYNKTFSCGTELNVDTEQLKNMYAKCYDGLKEKK